MTDARRQRRHQFGGEALQHTQLHERLQAVAGHALADVGLEVVGQFLRQRRQRLRTGQILMAELRRTLQEAQSRRPAIDEGIELADLFAGVLLAEQHRRLIIVHAQLGRPDDPNQPVQFGAPQARYPELTGSKHQATAGRHAEHEMQEQVPRPRVLQPVHTIDEAAERVRHLGQQLRRGTVRQDEGATQVLAQGRRIVVGIGQAEPAHRFAGLGELPVALAHHHRATAPRRTDQHGDHALVVLELLNQTGAWQQVLHQPRGLETAAARRSLRGGASPPFDAEHSVLLSAGS
nr:hypothetical protein [Gammaproteobacteria bacterium]